MKDIKILGPGCPRCEELYKLTRQVTLELKMECNLQKITDINEITSHGVMFTPALVVDGKVIVSGKVPRVQEIKKLLTG
jgi:small redox-active disulfide protein 2